MISLKLYNRFLKKKELNFKFNNLENKFSKLVTQNIRLNIVRI